LLERDKCRTIRRRPRYVTEAEIAEGQGKYLFAREDSDPRNSALAAGELELAVRQGGIRCKLAALEKEIKLGISDQAIPLRAISCHQIPNDSRKGSNCRADQKDARQP
jgi:hypothetical protein